jgi:hypothetical protein
MRNSYYYRWFDFEAVSGLPVDFVRDSSRRSLDMDMNAGPDPRIFVDGSGKARGLGG